MVPGAESHFPVSHLKERGYFAREKIVSRTSPYSLVAVVRVTMTASGLWHDDEDRMANDRDSQRSFWQKAQRLLFRIVERLNFREQFRQGSLIFLDHGLNAGHYRSIPNSAAVKASATVCW